MKLPVALALVGLTTLPALAHHSFAAYDLTKTVTLTGVVASVNPDAFHFMLNIALLNPERSALVLDDEKPQIWSVEMVGAALAAQQGITVDAFPRGTIVSLTFNPARVGLGGNRIETTAIFKCPEKTAPEANLHCDSVEGSKPFGEGTTLEVSPAPAGEVSSL
jgi:hypothetical protein